MGLTAVDGGLESEATVRIEPKAVTLAFSTSPGGLALTLNGTQSVGTPAIPTNQATFIVGSGLAIVAPSPQTLGGIQRTFTSWSDGSTSATRNLVAPASPWPSPLRANFVATSADVSIRQTGTLTSSGGGITWRVYAKNATGGLTATGLRVKVQLPGKLGVPIVLEAAGWSCRYKPAKDRLVCDARRSLPAWKSLIRFRTPIEGSGAQAKNVATVSSATRDVATANNTATTVVILP